MNAALPGGYPPVSPVTQHRKCDRPSTNCKRKAPVPNRIEYRESQKRAAGGDRHPLNVGVDSSHAFSHPPALPPRRLW